jgi:hypothetical protein
MAEKDINLTVKIETGGRMFSDEVIAAVKRLSTAPHPYRFFPSISAKPSTAIKHEWDESPFTYGTMYLNWGHHLMVIAAEELSDHATVYDFDLEEVRDVPIEELTQRSFKLAEPKP